MALLAAALRGCVCPLRELQLGGNQLRDADAVVLAEALRERASAAAAATAAPAAAAPDAAPAAAAITAADAAATDATAAPAAAAPAATAPAAASTSAEALLPQPPSTTMLPLRLDLSTNALSTEGLTALRAVCEVAAPFQRPLCERTFVGFDKCVYGAVADEHALYLAHGGGPVTELYLLYLLYSLDSLYSLYSLHSLYLLYLPWPYLLYLLDLLY